ncbi:septum site-determining protein Ssd [Uniformispora flossi]|uniref:septum site-determining protein Ssd n=1 Tax=Uniformispora flossi TaxID=3390723 RepID=UPI003C30034A
MSALSPVCPPGLGRPLVVTADVRLLDELLRMCAVANVEPEVVPQPQLACEGWVVSPLVVVGADLADGVASFGLPRRKDVVLVSADLDDADVWRRAVVVGADHVVFLPDAEAWLTDRFADLADGTGAAALGIAVVGARGGAGASTLACALAVTAARDGGTAALVDADPFGGGIDILLGGEAEPGLRWPDLAGARGRVDGGALSAALPRLHGLTVLSWDRGPGPGVPQEATRAIVSALRRRHDLTVVDIPRRPDPAAEEAFGQCVLGLVVIPAELRAVAAAVHVAEWLRPVVADLRAVVRGPSPSRLPADEIAANAGLPLAGELRPEPGLTEAVEEGAVPGGRKGPLSRFCREFLAAEAAAVAAERGWAA